MLIVDLDPQGNASTGLGIAAPAPGRTYDVLMGEPLAEAAVPTAGPAVHRAVDDDLSGVELELGQARDRSFRLRDALAALRHAGADEVASPMC